LIDAHPGARTDKAFRKFSEMVELAVVDVDVDNAPVRAVDPTFVVLRDGREVHVAAPTGSSCGGWRNLVNREKAMASPADAKQPRFSL
jgi:hypothetical protein